jgi:hypothetical protein
MDNSANRDNGKRTHIMRLLDGAVAAERRAASWTHNPHMAADVARERAEARRLRKKAASLTS